MTEVSRIAIVTGANRGLGLVIARVLARQRYSLIIGGRDRDALDGAARELSEDAPAVVPVSGDITDSPDPLELPPDGEVLICCAQPGTDIVLDM